MKRTIVIYSLAIAGLAILMQWLEYFRVVRVFSTEMYAVVVAILFTALGIWVGNRLTRKPRSDEFKRNDKAIASLRISAREIDVLELLAEGHSNQEISEQLFVTVNTVKTHLGRLYDKLDVSRRTQAVQKARTLRLIE